ncbi:MAG: hypothetical protein K2I96_08325 [Lachnospiraceae bacterium]|nr:hypothetical protein [Lachnospiraceae bacterium]
MRKSPCYTNLSKFCTCQNFSCPLHPTKHDKGCAPCISKNLRLKEVPSCFFNLVENADQRADDSFCAFAELVLKTLI